MIQGIAPRDTRGGEGEGEDDGGGGEGPQRTLGADTGEKTNVGEWAAWRSGSERTRSGQTEERRKKKLRKGLKISTLTVKRDIVGQNFEAQHTRPRSQTLTLSLVSRPWAHAGIVG